MSRNKNLRNSLGALVAAGALLLGCQNGSPGAAQDSDKTDAEMPDWYRTPTGAVQHALVRMGSCEELVRYAGGAQTDLLRSRLAEARFRLQLCQETGSVYLPGEESDCLVGQAGPVDALFGAPVSGCSEGAPALADSDPDYSRTNLQELNVDEPDIVKTDGKQIYVLSQRRLNILSAGAGGQLERSSVLSLGGWSQEMFLVSERQLAVVVVAPDENRIPKSIFDEHSPFTEIAIIDVSDPAAPKRIRDIFYPGSYVSARMVASSVRAVVASALNLPAPPTLDPEAYCGLPDDRGLAKFDADAREKIGSFGALLDTVTAEQMMPRKHDSASASDETIADCGDVYVPETPAGTGLVSVISIDLADPQTKKTDVAVIGESGIVYATEDSLYLATSDRYVAQAAALGVWDSESSGIHKFDIASDPSKALYKATGTVDGRLLGQFSLGEKDRFLRVASTTGTALSAAGDERNTLENHLCVLEEEDGALNVAGRLDGIAPEEAIYAARFLGDRGFLATYGYQDPLLTFDLSDPRNPRQVGEWEGLGAITYLHPFGENQLIALGEEGAETALSLYDVSDLKAPVLVDRYNWDELDHAPGIADQFGAGPSMGSAESPAISDHKAFSLDAEAGLLALPYAFPLGGLEVRANYSGIALFGVDETGFTLSGATPMWPEIYEQTLPNGDRLVFTESDAARSVFIGDYVYAISQCRVTSAAAASPSAIIDTEKLNDENTCD